MKHLLTDDSMIMKQIRYKKIKPVVMNEGMNNKRK